MFVVQPQHDTAENGSIRRRRASQKRFDCIEPDPSNLAVEQVGDLRDNAIHVEA
ncbi:hypothetical protein [Mesorhizobium sp. M5C.F.Ca.IN.020.32.2.1]|uniref:hypothetical protein n=1 Tax=Mesorhizobium sp. M5C.F.Ca.IN.020.32.2.1 TaxID=2496771 RepID=UPI0013E36E0E|nr:hypothetical protein [Mesorhizobium sp. M5C.F.Ca.IN.020.32.2.1]